VSAPARPLNILELRSVLGTGGGPEKTILLGASRADPARFRVTVCYLCAEGDQTFGIGARAAALGIDYVELRERHPLDLRVWRHLQRLVADRGIHIVHAHDYKTDLLALLLGRGGRVIPLATAHGWTGHSRRERRLYYPADRRILARYPRVIAVSSDIRRALIGAGADPARITVVLNGIDPAAFVRDPSRRPAARAQYGVRDGQFVIGAVGRLEPQKRFDRLIRAFQGLAPACPSLVLLIAGDGSLRSRLHRDIAETGLTDRIRLVGHVHDVAGFHHALDLFVQSSDYEGTPNAVLEAMALETPIIATDAGGTSEVARDGLEALIVRSDTDEMARAIRQAIGDPDAARRRAAAARRRVETDLSFEHRMRTVERIYEELAAGLDPAGRRLKRRPACASG